MKLKILLLVTLLSVTSFSLFSQTMAQFTQSGRTIIYGLDDVNIVRYEGSSSSLLIGSRLSRQQIDESGDEVLAASCNTFIKLTLYNSIPNIGNAGTVILVNRRYIESMTDDSFGRAYVVLENRDFRIVAQENISTVDLSCASGGGTNQNLSLNTSTNALDITSGTGVNLSNYVDITKSTVNPTGAPGIGAPSFFHNTANNTFWFYDGTAWVQFSNSTEVDFYIDNLGTFPTIVPTVNGPYVSVNTFTGEVYVFSTTGWIPIGGPEEFLINQTGIEASLGAINAARPFIPVHNAITGWEVANTTTTLNCQEAYVIGFNSANQARAVYSGTIKVFNTLTTGNYYFLQDDGTYLVTPDSDDGLGTDVESQVCIVQDFNTISLYPSKPVITAAAVSPESIELTDDRFETPVVTDDSYIRFNADNQLIGRIEGSPWLTSTGASWRMQKSDGGTDNSTIQGSPTQIDMFLNTNELGAAYSWNGTQYRNGAGIRYGQSTITGTQVIDLDVSTVRINASADIQPVLPDASGLDGTRLTVLRVDNNDQFTVRLSANTGQTIRGLADRRMGVGDGLIIESNGSNWEIISEFLFIESMGGPHVAVLTDVDLNISPGSSWGFRVPAYYDNYRIVGVEYSVYSGGVTSGNTDVALVINGVNAFSGSITPAGFSTQVSGTQTIVTDDTIEFAITAESSPVRQGLTINILVQKL